MKVHNLTDQIPAGKPHANTPLVVGRYLIPPGTSLEIEDTPKLRKQLSVYVTQQLAAVDALPPSYVLSKRGR